MHELSATATIERLDYFISYTGVDEKEAEWIAWQLEKAGYSVIIQKWDFRPGHNFPLRMQESASRAMKTLVVLSRAYFYCIQSFPLINS